MTPLSDALTAAHEKAMDAQFAEAYADVYFYERGFPLADFADVPAESPVSPTDGKDA